LGRTAGSRLRLDPNPIENCASTCCSGTDGAASGADVLPNSKCTTSTRAAPGVTKRSIRVKGNIEQNPDPQRRSCQTALHSTTQQESWLGLFEAFGGKSLCLQQCRLIPQLRFADRVLAGSFPTGWYMRPVNLLSAVDKAYESYLAISI